MVTGLALKGLPGRVTYVCLDPENKSSYYKFLERGQRDFTCILHSGIKMKSQKSRQREDNWMNGRECPLGKRRGRLSREEIGSIRSEGQFPSSLHSLRVIAGRAPSAERKRSQTTPLSSVRHPKEEI